MVFVMCLAAGAACPALPAAAQHGAGGVRAGVREPPASIFPLEPAWTADLGRPPAAAPGYDDVHAYVPLRDGTLAAIRLGDGETAWISARRTGFPPAAAGGSVIVAAGATLVALRATDAQPLWTREFAAPISAAPLRTAGWLVVSLASGEVAALRAADGRELWRRALDGPLRVRPAVGGRRLFVPIDDGRLVALDLTAGTPLWERTLRGNPREVLPLDAVFVGATDNYLYRLSPEDGSLDWRWRAGGDVVGLPAVDESRLFFTSLDNMLWALDRNSGVQQWRRPLPGRPRAGPVIVGRALFVAGVSAQIRAFDREHGRPAGILSAVDELGAPPHFAAAPAGSGPGVVLPIADGRLVGMRPATGPPPFPLDFPPPPLLPAPAPLVPADVLPVEPTGTGAARGGRPDRIVRR